MFEGCVASRILRYCKTFIFESPVKLFFMIITSDTDPRGVLQKIARELDNGSSDSRHPFRYLSLATVDTEMSAPNIRMVILREITDDWRIFAYTDARSTKVEELKQLNRAALLFWHPHHKTQVTLTARVTLHQDDEVAQKYWQQDVHGPARKAYTPLVSPGTVIDRPEEAHRWPESYSMDHFCVLECELVDLQVLQINGKEHRRLSFQREGHTDTWTGQWIAP